MPRATFRPVRRLLLPTIFFSFSLLLSATAQTLYPDTPPGYDLGDMANAIRYDILRDGKGLEKEGVHEFTLTWLVRTDGRVTDVSTEGEAPPLYTLGIVMNRMTPATWRGEPVVVMWEMDVRYYVVRKGPERHLVVTIDGESFSERIPEGKVEAEGAMLSVKPARTIVEPDTAGTIDTKTLAERLIRDEHAWGHSSPYTIGLMGHIVIEPDSSHGAPVAIRVLRPSLDSTLSGSWVNLLYDALLDVGATPGLGGSDGSPVRSLLEVPVLVIVTREEGEQRRIRIGLMGQEPTGYTFASGPERHLMSEKEIEIESGPIADIVPLLPAGAVIREGALSFIPWASPASYDPDVLAENIDYPQIARDNGLEGNVILMVYISSTGDVGKVEVLRTGNPIFNEAAIDAVRKTSFTPAVQNGIAINYRMSVLVRFALESAEK